MSGRDRRQMARMTVLDLNVAQLPAQVHARFWSKVDVLEDLDACWLWTGAVSRPSIRDLDNRARPRFRLTHKPNVVVYAHRFVLALNLAVSMRALENHEACHVEQCSSVLCVNPRHLYRGTPDQNRDDRYPWRRARLPLQSE